MSLAPFIAGLCSQSIQPAPALMPRGDPYISPSGKGALAFYEVGPRMILSWCSHGPVRVDALVRSSWVCRPRPAKDVEGLRPRWRP